MGICAPAPPVAAEVLAHDLAASAVATAMLLVADRVEKRIRGEMNFMVRYSCCLLKWNLRFRPLRWRRPTSFTSASGRLSYAPSEVKSQSEVK